MRIGLVISDRGLTRPIDTSLLLAFEAARAGHRAVVWGIGDLTVHDDGRMLARAVEVPRPAPATAAELHAHLVAPSTPADWVDVSELDLLLLRVDPNDGPGGRTWSHHTTIQLGQRARDVGVDVVNDPAGLLRSLDKSYLARLPREVVPRSLVSRDVELLRDFVEELGAPVAIKPASGAGGRRVFRVDHSADHNLSQLLEMAAEDGYAMVQEYVDAAATEGTTRLFLVGGAPLVVGGRFAALRHCPGPNDHRSNIHAGGSVAPAELGPADVAAAEAAAPVLASDGIEIAGIDLAGGKVLEVNVFSPGGMWGVERFEGPGFVAAIVDHLVTRNGRHVP
jgi:glutathione synthase